jgi:hypothetical protein
MFTGKTNPSLDAPVIPFEFRDKWNSDGVVPIVVYPEVVTGNPLGGDCVVRWLLYYAGMLGGDKEFDPECMYYSYHAGMNPWVEDEKILCMPLVDRGIFSDWKTGDRRGGCFYAAKYADHFGLPLLDVTDGMVEITRGHEGDQTPGQIAALFNRCEYFYTYEDTMLISEARMCGCPVVCLPNEKFKFEFSEKDNLGVAVGTAPEQLRWARETVGMYRDYYQQGVYSFALQAKDFLEETQEFAKTRKPGLAIEWVKCRPNGGKNEQG